LPSLRLLASAIHAFAFFIDVAGPVPKCRREIVGQISVRDDGDRPIGGIVGGLTVALAVGG
jgi:hypothetical protein